MKLHFITSISKEYWYSTAQYCISTWNLPGKVTIYLEQREGEIEWTRQLPHQVMLLVPPTLPAMNNNISDRAKVQKFWGKSYAQMSAVGNREEDERIIWIDADIEQVAPVDASLFDFSFQEPVAIMDSGDGQDRWESGIVIFNQYYTKLDLFMKKYSQFWNDEEKLASLWKPYDAQVLGQIALDRGYYNLCKTKCINADAMKNSRYANQFVHWINKTNKEILKNKHATANSNNLS